MVIFELASTDTMQSKIQATVLGLVAEIERDFISARTKEALAKRKADGVQLCRPAGPAKKLRLDVHADKIDNYLAKGIDKTAIAKLLDVAPNTLYAWLRVRRPGMTVNQTDPVREFAEKLRFEKPSQPQIPGTVPQVKVFSQDSFVRVKRS